MMIRDNVGDLIIFNNDLIVNMIHRHTWMQWNHLLFVITINLYHWMFPTLELVNQPIIRLSILITVKQLDVLTEDP